MAVARHELLTRILFAPYFAMRHGAATASRFYGPFGLHSLPLQLGLTVSRDDAGRETLPGGEVVDIVLERILTARTILAVGLFTFLVQVTYVLDWNVDWLGEWFRDTMIRGVFVMIIAPFLVFLVIGLLVWSARPGLRHATFRAGREPAKLALITLAFVSVIALVALDADNNGPMSRAVDWVATTDLGTSPFFIAFVMLPTIVALFWFGGFFVSVIYLTQRNGMSKHRTLPLLPPLVLIGIAVLTLPLGLDDGGTSGWRELLHDFGPPVAIGILSVLEIRLLGRRYGYTFRNPVKVAPGAGSRADASGAG